VEQQSAQQKDGLVTQDTYAKPRSGGMALKPTPFGGFKPLNREEEKKKKSAFAYFTTMFGNVYCTMLSTK
jgi:hypothetical protein